MKLFLRCAVLLLTSSCLLPSWVNAAQTVQAATSTTEQQALLVLNRLAYGPKPGDITRVSRMGVDRYIDEQLHPENIPLPAMLTQRLDALDTVNQAPGQLLEKFLALRRAAKQSQTDNKEAQRDFVKTVTEEAAAARLIRAIDSPRQLQEVMVEFWFNHFNVFAGKGLDRVFVASYERDAIRPYVLGSFRDLLGATAKHPAMFFYLDNWRSTSADFQPRARKKQEQTAKPGLNENYAREVMELHTLGVNGGYTQKDVAELARILTGWTFNQRTLITQNEQFQFDDKRHDQGDKIWLGHQFSAQGQQEGERALDILAMHPSTAHHLSYELAQYFVQDNPPAALVDRLAQRYLATHGNIREVLRTLFDSKEFRSQATTKTGQASKFKTPYQFIVSAARAGQVHAVNVRPFIGALHQLGMPLYGCQTPDGYKNTESAWLNPDALTRRIAFAGALSSGRLPLDKTPAAADNTAENRNNFRQPSPPLDASMLLDTLGSSIADKTRSIIEAQPASLRASMVLGSPDFMHH